MQNNVTHLSTFFLFGMENIGFGFFSLPKMLSKMFILIIKWTSIYTFFFQF